MSLRGVQTWVGPGAKTPPEFMDRNRGGGGWGDGGGRGGRGSHTALGLQVAVNGRHWLCFHLLGVEWAPAPAPTMTLGWGRLGEMAVRSL